MLNENILRMLDLFAPIGSAKVKRGRLKNWFNAVKLALDQRRIAYVDCKKNNFDEKACWCGWLSCGLQASFGIL